jgi:hypothetical protein
VVKYFSRGSTSKTVIADDTEITTVVGKSAQEGVIFDDRWRNVNVAYQRARNDGSFFLN